MNKLKPCPFCGSRNIFRSTDHIDPPYTSYVFCINCKSRSGDEISTDKEISIQLAVNAWNRRVKER